MIAAAVDITGVLVNLTVSPELVQALIGTTAGGDLVLLVVFHSMESLASALTNLAAFGLYSLAGMLLLPAVFSTPSYQRWLAWLGTAEWGIAALAIILPVLAPGLATGPLLIRFALYTPWVWGSAVCCCAVNQKRDLLHVGTYQTKLHFVNSSMTEPRLWHGWTSI